MPSVTRKAQAGRKQRRAELESQLLRATERLMGEGLTFTELSVDRLATAAGVSRATFYVYFEDKTQLLRAFADQVFEELTGAARQWWDVAEHRRTEDVRRAMADVIAAYRRHQAVLTAVIETAGYDVELGAAYRAIHEAISDEVAQVIERGKAAGSIRAGLPARETAAALNWLVERTVHQTVRFTPPERDAVLAETLTEIIWSTLYLTPATG
ncbi:TetR/AcrR family transcriptional regulator [Streptomyces ipomoeae]|uniref:TetR/AcrR family transcriptional regulator n=1 Tax=Streptomyces ipomoeae TaxID=103232 RepID=UPI001147A0F7|nr:TetR/AcrR family transcriptional regulator [Streptomyces ipomoeae]MDX2937745.1 TetR/AcrR family transcriptional regulator [Streptomyces ipomoeae]TQE17248.1 TetR/AcrR family transcriptional regulator [Streptomyces ipomoeae]